MEKLLVGTGVACAIAAVFGGGLSLLGITFPVLSSVRRQVVLALIGVALVPLGMFWDRVKSAKFDSSQIVQAGSPIVRKPMSEGDDPAVHATPPVANFQQEPLRAPPVTPAREGSSGYIYLGQRDGNRWAMNRYAGGAIIDTDRVPKPGETHIVRQDVNLRTRLPSDEAPLVMSGSMGAVYAGTPILIHTVSRIGREGFYWAAVQVLQRPSE